MIKKIITTICALSTSLLFFHGCRSAATEQEKANFSNTVLQQENQTDKLEVDDAIDPGYQPSAAGTPSWEMPAA